MKNIISVTCLTIVALVAPLAVHAADTGADADRTHPRTFVKDSVITTKVKAKLAREEAGSLARVRVDTHGHGKVVLSGKVRSQDEADKAITIARAVEGVT